MKLPNQGCIPATPSDHRGLFVALRLTLVAGSKKALHTSGWLFGSDSRWPRSQSGAFPVLHPVHSVSFSAPRLKHLLQSRSRLFPVAYPDCPVFASADRQELLPLSTRQSHQED